MWAEGWSDWISLRGWSLAAAAGALVLVGASAVALFASPDSLLAAPPPCHPDRAPRLPRIFIYELGGNLTSGLDEVPRWPDFERLFLRVLESSPAITRDPGEADWFYIPHAVTRVFEGNGSKPGWERAEDHLARVVGRIVLEWPYFNRSAGLDHFTALAHDSWYHVLRSDRVASVLPLSFRHNVLLVANQGDDGSLPMFGGSEPPGFMPSFLPLRDICVTPPSWNATEFRQKGNRTWTRAAWRDRRYLAVFRGAIDMNLTIHSGGVRQALYGMLKGDRDILFGRTNPFHARELLDSKFCLFIRGFNVWSERMGTLVNAGCIPVIVADRYVLPFWQTIDWREISVRIPERDALVPGRLKGILRGIPEGRAMAMEARLAEVSRNLTWYLPPRPGDAMDQVLAILGSKTPRLRPVPNAFWDGRDVDRSK